MGPPVKSETIKAAIVTASNEDLAWDYVSAANADLFANEEHPDRLRRTLMWAGDLHDPT